MKIIKIICSILCAILLFSFASCEEPIEDETTEPKIEQTEQQLTEAMTAPETTAQAPETEEETTEDETTSPPEPEAEPMQIPEGYTVKVTTEFPLIATLGGEKADVTVRAAALRSKYDVHWIYVDVVRDEKVICTKLWRAVGQLMATTEKSEYFILLRILDNSASATATTAFESYCVSDAKGTPEIVKGGGSNSSMSVELNTEAAQPMDHAAQSGHYRRFLNGINIEDFELKNSRLCMVLDSLSDPEKEAFAYPSDALPIYDLNGLGEHSFYVKLKEQYDRFEKLKSIWSSLETATPQLPEGMSVMPDTLRCSDGTVTVDGLNYKMASRTFTLCDANGNACGQYTDYVSHYDLTIVSVEITQ